MSTAICVYGLWHLGCVTAACLAAEGFQVTGLDPDDDRVSDLVSGKPPIAEPGLTDLIREQQSAGALTFTSDTTMALGNVDVLLVAFDTPVDEDDQADI